MPQLWTQTRTFEILPKAFAFTRLGLAAGGEAFSFKNGSTWFGLPHTGYPLIFPCTIRLRELESIELKST